MIKPPVNIDPDKYLSRYMVGFQSEDLIKEMKDSTAATLELLENVTEEKANYRYAEGKWTIKQVIRHIADTERIFGYRALCFSRDKNSNLPGFDENHYADMDNSDALSLEEVINDYKAVRESTIQLYSTMGEKALDSEGKGSGAVHTARDLGWVNVGHNLHHLRVLEERYF